MVQDGGPFISFANDKEACQIKLFYLIMYRCSNLWPFMLCYHQNIDYGIVVSMFNDDFR